MAAVATALSVAAPRWIRPVVIVAGSVAVGLMIVAVIGLRWHYPTDALAGAVLGYQRWCSWSTARFIWLGPLARARPHHRSAG